MHLKILSYKNGAYISQLLQSSYNYPFMLRNVTAWCVFLQGPNLCEAVGLQNSISCN